MDIAFAGDTHLVETTPRSRKDVFYQSVLKKMEYVIFNNDVTIFLGDLFHKPATSNVVMSGLMDLLIRAEQAGKRVYTIIGNHDVPMASVEEENLSKTSLNILFKTGLIKELKCETFGPLVVEAIPFVRKTDNLSFYTEHRPIS